VTVVLFVLAVILYLLAGFIVFGVFGGFAPPLTLPGRLASVIAWPAFLAYACTRPSNFNRDLDDIHEDS
jgi:hypothetical protein